MGRITASDARRAFAGVRDPNFLKQLEQARKALDDDTKFDWLIPFGELHLASI